VKKGDRDVLSIAKIKPRFKRSEGSIYRTETSKV
jgi:hypothetical protein